LTEEPEVEVPAEELEDKQPPALQHAERLVDNAPRAEAPIRELTLVYETNADEYFPADVELEEDYSDRSETRQLRTPATPERIEGAPLPYEGGFEEQAPPAGKSTDVDNFDTGRNEAEPSPKIAEEKKSKSTDRTDSAQLRLPRMD
jgi:hypothetical protein